MATLEQMGITQNQLDSHWMAYSGNRQFKQDPRIIKQAKGNYYYDADSRKIFDGLSGLWTCGLGHGRQEITEAITKQANQLDYSPAFQFGHPASFQLAEKITEFMPAGLNRVFFTGSGSESADTSLKIARAYWRKKGLASKTKLIGRGKGYHGVNFGGISVGGIGPNRAIFGAGVDAAHMRHTVLPENAFTKGQPEKGAELANDLLDLIAVHDASNIAAVIVEPMAGSAGVIPPPLGYLTRLREICDQHQILLIFDEVICAFGRLGYKTGAEACGVTPDIINMAKQLTNGVIPMGAVACKQEIYDTFMAEGGPDYMLELPHGYTYSAHPIACAAALATLDLLEKEHTIERAREMSPLLERAAHQLAGLELVSDIRNMGLAVGLNLVHAPGEPALNPYLVAQAMWQQGFYVRYGADTIQIAPPFTVTANEIDSLFNALGDTIQHLSGHA
ncbi:MULTISPECIES: aspartate aminotransferase family protein [unclassified Agarivorans]|uniref:aspartate aminotransferase family protein n=1 Tax=unclassified Agarivorans TaxID=2636026 RepID=UPI0026E38869|nr:MULTISPECIES: aspartate aminotransferase family protein [unclassified Agarivorans]MDO6685624.1 aspartate aminotransferase family protein [Agarivorans sp. 3_MG-2023]MDO6716010.1 aspartate aminotransferase family protein [Agarivorans sp. 2_MG-2023]